LNSNKEHEDMNADRPLDKSGGEANTAPADEESAFADLLHVLGFKRKKNGAENLHSASQTLPDVPISADVPDAPDSPIPANIPASESLNNEEEDLASEGSSESSFGTDFSNTATAAALPDMTAPACKKPKARKVFLIALAVLMLAVGVYFALPYLTEPVPPGEGVVASYNARNVTIEELKSFITLEQAKELEHGYCDIHGYDHTKCTPDEGCESHPIDSLAGYQQMVARLAVEQIIQEWAASQGVTQREDVQHGIKDLLDNASVSQLMARLHEEEITPESISSWDVQQYYDDNRDSYSGKAFTEVEDEIRQILVAQKDQDFFTEYIEKLKQTEGLKVNFDLLKVKEPTDNEVSAYYNQNVSEYQVPQTAEALEIRMTTGDTQNAAAEAIRKIRSGEGFDSVAATYGQGGKASELAIEKGSGDAAIEAVIWNMQSGDISDPITNSDGSASIIKLVSTTKAGTRPLDEVKSEILLILLQKNMEREYTLRKDEALFSVHSRRYTLGDFYTEFKELSPAYQAQFSTFDQKQQLVEQLIVKELLLEETGDSSSDEREQHSYDELKIQYLSQILHQQEVDEKLTDPTEDEMKSFYDKNKESFVSPASAQISLIWIDQGLNGEKAEQARQKADEALSLLNSGTDFAEVAKKYSEDGSAVSGGEIDEMLYESHLPEQLATAIFALQAGETSNIIDYNYGYYMIKVRERTEERQMTYEESAESIKAYLREEKHYQLESEMEKVLLENADFTIYDKTLRKLLREQSNP